MNNNTEALTTAKELEVLQDIFIFLLLDASLPQQTVRKIVKVELSRVTRIGKLLKNRRKE
jgi:hypothetical protein